MSASQKKLSKDLFMRLPEFHQDYLIWAYSKLPLKYKYGKGYIFVRKLLETTRNYNKDQLQEFQFNQFLSIYKHALENIPFYKKFYAEYGLGKNSIKSPEDTARIPFITKDIVRNNTEDFIWPSIIERKRIKKETGGTTGYPLTFYSTKLSRQQYRAFIHDIWERVGHKPYDFKIVLKRSDHYRFKDGTRQYYNPKTNLLYLSYSDLNKEIAKKYIEILKRKKPKFIIGYSSVIFIFAQIISELNMSTPHLKAVFCDSQKLLASQREIIEKVFGCRVFTHYGLAEKVILAAECEYSHDYHVVPEYGYTELIDNNSKIIKGPNEVGELVGTGFYNKVMPLIRYRTADLAAYSKNQTCKCGRPHEILSSLIGRTQDFLVTAEGTLKSTAPNAFYTLSKYCRGFQLVQEVPGMVEIRVIPKSDNPPIYKEAIRRELKKEILRSMNFTIVETSSLEKSASGKPKFLIQKLKTPHDHEESVTYLVPE